MHEYHYGHESDAPVSLLWMKLHFDRAAALAPPRTHFVFAGDSGAVDVMVPGMETIRRPTRAFLQEAVTTWPTH